MMSTKQTQSQVKELQQVSVYLDPDDVFDLDELVLKLRRKQRDGSVPLPFSPSKPNSLSRNDLIRYGVDKVLKELTGLVD